jgi:hypothetical protein
MNSTSCHDCGTGNASVTWSPAWNLWLCHDCRTTRTDAELGTVAAEAGGDSPFDARELLGQIGMGNLMAISGGRFQARETGVTLPVSNGYTVTVDLDIASDTYTVRRIFKRGTKTWVKGERTQVYADEVSEAAYYASCFRSYSEIEWVAKS